MGDLGNYDEGYGSVDLFGLDEFGQPQGLSQSWGAAIGSATQAGVAIGLKEYTKLDHYAEGIGGVAGAAIGGAMIAMGPGSRAAGWTTVISSLVQGGLRQLHCMVSHKEKAKNEASKETKDLKGLGLVEIEPSATVGPAGLMGHLGLPTIDRQALVPGSAGLNGELGMPAQLVGAGDYGLANNPGAQQAQLVGPQLSGLGSHFGSTLFG